MLNVNSESKTENDLVKICPNSCSSIVKNILPTKKHARKRLVKPHLRAHRVYGNIYYSFCKGTDREIYLGDAETILSWKPGESK